ncbi:UNKNOWN [Stylonychia lemnae]|uniref:Uncharacterized protein n=1 Tax=Stylonychia lemnae TaxID=5949 RepID=A0A078A6F8_STYLE|nr:UNKNOWN [Stylonychia lemnae]|eukprot:CDW77789.1 UNKNOWN [Stylonychia lemnae]
MSNVPLPNINSQSQVKAFILKQADLLNYRDIAAKKKNEKMQISQRTSDQSIIETSVISNVNGSCNNNFNATLSGDKKQLAKQCSAVDPHLIQSVNRIAGAINAAGSELNAEDPSQITFRSKSTMLKTQNSSGSLGLQRQPSIVNKYKDIQSKINSRSQMPRASIMFQPKDLIDLVLEKESQKNNKVQKQKTKKMDSILSPIESEGKYKNIIDQIDESEYVDDFEETSSFTDENKNYQGLNQQMLLPNIKNENNLEKNNSGQTYLNSKSFSSMGRSQREGLKFDLKIDLLDDQEDGQKTSKNQGRTPYSGLLRKNSNTQSLGHSRFRRTNTKSFNFLLTSIQEQVNNHEPNIQIEPLDDLTDKYQPQSTQENLQGKENNQSSKYLNNLTLNHSQKSFNTQSKYSQMQRQEILNKIGEHIKILIQNMGDSNDPHMFQMKNRRSAGGVNKSFDHAMFDHVQSEALKKKDQQNFHNYLLMRKGINLDYKEEYKIQQFSKQFERRAFNPAVKQKKDSVMTQLMTTFTNKSYLNTLKKSNLEISDQLLKMGMNYDNYKSLAQQVNSNYHFKNQRISLRERNKQYILRQDSEKHKKDLEQHSSPEQKKIFKQLRQILKRQDIATTPMDDEIQKKEKSPEQVKSQEKKQDTGIKIKDKMQALNLSINTGGKFKSTYSVQQSPQSISVFEQKNDGKILDVLNEKGFSSMIEALNIQYKAQEPVDSPFLRRYQNQPNSQSGMLSPSLSGKKSLGGQTPLSPGRRKKLINPKFLLNDLFLNQGTKALDKKVSSVKFSGGIPHHSMSHKKMNDSEIQEFSKYVNYLLLKSSDDFIKHKFKKFQEKTSPERSLQYDSFDKQQNTFFERMKEDSKCRQFLDKVIKEVRENGEERKLQRLRKLTEITNFMKDNIIVEDEQYLIKQIREEINKLDENELSKQLFSLRNKKKKLTSRSYSDMKQNSIFGQRKSINVIPITEKKMSIPVIQNDAQSMIKNFMERRMTKLLDPLQAPNSLRDIKISITQEML